MGRATPLLTIIILFCGQTACGVADLFKQQKSKDKLPEITVTSEKDDASKNASVSYPDGLLPDGVSVTLEEGDSVLGETYSSALAIDQDLESAGPSINLSAQGGDVPEDRIDQIQITIPLSNTSALLEDDRPLAVAYHIKKNGKYFFGLIGRANLAILEGKKVRFNSRGFGNYQAIYLSQEIDEPEEVVTDSSVLTKSEASEPEANLAPVFASIGNKAATWQEGISFTLSASDGDGDSLTFSCKANCPTGLSVASSGAVSWTTTSGDVGTYSQVTFAVSDGQDEATATISIVISPPAHVTSGLVAYYDAEKADEGAPVGTACDTTLYWDDLTVNASHMYSVNFTASGAGTCGTNEGWVGTGTSSSPHALAFRPAGSSDYNYIRMTSDVSAFQLSGSAISLETWVRPAAIAERIIFGKGTHNNTNYVGSYLLTTTATGAPNLHLNAINNGVLKPSTTTLSASTWNHIVATYDGSNIRYYVNGLLTNTRTGFAGMLAGTADPFGIGYSNSNAKAWDGQVAIVRLYDRTLSSTEVVQNCTAHEHRFADIDCP